MEAFISSLMELATAVGGKIILALVVLIVGSAVIKKIVKLVAKSKGLSAPEPFARLSGGSNEAMEFTVRAWCKGEDYWDVYFDLTQAITEAMGAKGVQAPAVRVVTQ